ncbi:kinetochore-associated protein DSN1 homolog isoform X2 [Narcine bancroftii]|uniref:kinetochore-associated protein DSN1 homolog isoform X2 n=1 Tax=Narcine bancroftii TaxID=1343680 RepID=UPI0038312CC9
MKPRITLTGGPFEVPLSFVPSAGKAAKMAEDGSVKKRLRNASPNTSQPNQALSSSKKKSTRYQKHVESEICDAIRLDLPEEERLAELFRMSLEYTLQKLESQNDFSLHTFQTDASGISNDVKRIIETMKLDGTLRKCTEDPEDVPPTPETEMLMEQLKNDISRLNAECDTWNQLLEVYCQNVDQAANNLEQAKVTRGASEPSPVMENSQMDVITSKPDYQPILDKDALILQSMECIMEQITKTMNLINTARQEWDSCLQHICKQMAAQAFEGLEANPLQKFLRTTKKGALDKVSESHLPAPGAQRV